MTATLDVTRQDIVSDRDPRRLAARFTADGLAFAVITSHSMGGIRSHVVAPFRAGKSCPLPARFLHTGDYNAARTLDVHDETISRATHPAMLPLIIEWAREGAER